MDEPAEAHRENHRSPCPEPQPLIIDGVSHREREFAWWLHLGNKPAEFTAFNSRAEALTSRWGVGMKQRGFAPATWYIEKGKSFRLGGAAFALAAITTTAMASDALN